MHIEVTTTSSDVDGTISPEEFFEGLNLLGIAPETLDVPMVHYRAFQQAYGTDALAKSLFRILCLHLCSPTASTSDANIIDMLAGAERITSTREYVDVRLM